jgi:hypothetical protein
MTMIREGVPPTRDYKREYEATHVMVSHPDDSENPERYIREAWTSPMTIVLDVGERVWVAASYSHEGHPEVKRIGSGDDDGYDMHGNCVLSIPASWCRFITDEEANQIVEIQDADEYLRSCAY